MGHIFISYSRREREFVDSFVSRIESAGQRVWIDHQKIQAGGLWRTQIVQAIDTCDGFVLMLSTNSAASDNVRREVDIALDSGRHIYIMLLEPVKLPADMRYELIGLQYIDIQMLGAHKAAKQLIETLGEEVEKTREQPVRQIELVIPGIDKGDRKRKEQLVDFLSMLTRTHPSQLEVNPGTVSDHVVVDMPAQAAFELKTRALNRDSRLKKFGIKSLRLLGNRRYINTSLGILTAATVGLMNWYWLSISTLFPSLFGTTTGNVIFITLVFAVTTVVSLSVSSALLPTPTPILPETPTSLLNNTPTTMSVEILSPKQIDTLTEIATQTPTETPTAMLTQTPMQTPTHTSPPMPTNTLPVPTDTLPAPTNTPQPTPTLPNELAAHDGSEGVMPDFQTLTVRYDDEAVYITLALIGLDKITGSEFIYMRGTHFDLVRLLPGSFRIERDNDRDGLFEEVIYAGATDNTIASAIAIRIPIVYLPDISTKEIWVYSMNSQDRLPDSAPGERLRFPTPSQ
jgi:TIR domain